jgi:hypothetical protein
MHARVKRETNFSLPKVKAYTRRDRYLMLGRTLVSASANRFRGTLESPIRVLKKRLASSSPSTMMLTVVALRRITEQPDNASHPASRARRADLFGF